jgi:hypothetical protein
MKLFQLILAVLFIVVGLFALYFSFRTPAGSVGNVTLRDVDLSYAMIVTASEVGVESFPAAWSSSDCGHNETARRTFCLKGAGEVVEHSFHVSSANCGSQILNVEKKDSKCIEAVEIRRGCGWGIQILGVKECRGRGWLNYTMELRKKSAEAREYAGQPIKRQSVELPARLPLAVAAPSGADGIVKYQFKFTYNGIAHLLSDAKPSNELLSTRVQLEAGQPILEVMLPRSS